MLGVNALQVTPGNRFNGSINGVRVTRCAESRLKLLSRLLNGAHSPEISPIPHVTFEKIRVTRLQLIRAS